MTATVGLQGSAARRAVRVRIQAPVASFRDPMFPGVQAGLPLPPPATVRGLLAAAHGSFDRLGRIQVGIAFHAAGESVDLETYHPLNIDGLARFPGVKQGPGPAERHFLIDADLTAWVFGSDLQRIMVALRRPVWPLRLGRSQDLARLAGLELVDLEPAAAGRQGGALVPADAADAAGEDYRLATWVAPDRRRTHYADFRWSRERDRTLHSVQGALADPDGHLVWPIDVNPPA